MIVRCFNVTGACSPQRHYMVDITKKLEEIKELIDAGAYFTINRARQYGKTTTIRALTDFLAGEYVVISLDFQKFGEEEFETGGIFAAAFADYLVDTIRNKKRPVEGLADEVIRKLESVSQGNQLFSLRRLFKLLNELCDTADKPVVLVIDEVDRAANNQIFLDFLAQLRSDYMNRDCVPTFQSVILAGVYDVKNIKRKLRPDEVHKTNSPWNVAADFLVDMSFSKKEIEGMLADYETEHHTGMDSNEMAELIFDYTSGYPYLVSKYCKLIDERIMGSDRYPDEKAAWTKADI